MNIIKFQVDDLLELKKAHPCGCSIFRVLRVGSEMRIMCTACKRDMTMDRIKLEKSTRKLLTSKESDSLS